MRLFIHFFPILVWNLQKNKRVIKPFFLSVVTIVVVCSGIILFVYFNSDACSDETILIVELKTMCKHISSIFGVEWT